MYLNKLGLQFQEPQQLKVTNTELQSFNWPPTICMQMHACKGNKAMYNGCML